MQDRGRPSNPREGTSVRSGDVVPMSRKEVGEDGRLRLGAISCSACAPEGAPRPRLPFMHILRAAIDCLGFVT